MLLTEATPYHRLQDLLSAQQHCVHARRRALSGASYIYITLNIYDVLYTLFRALYGVTRTHVYSYILMCTHVYSYILMCTHVYSYILIYTLRSVIYCVAAVQRALKSTLREAASSDPSAL